MKTDFCWHRYREETADLTRLLKNVHDTTHRVQKDLHLGTLIGTADLEAAMIELQTYFELQRVEATKGFQGNDCWPRDEE